MFCEAKAKLLITKTLRTPRNASQSFDFLGVLGELVMIRSLDFAPK
jgi:hypothetical protein